MRGTVFRQLLVWIFASNRGHIRELNSDEVRGCGRGRGRGYALVAIVAMQRFEQCPLISVRPYL